MVKITAVLAVLVVLSPCISADIITLKDDQKFAADVISFDSYYLTAVLENKKTVNIPWREVRFVKHTTTASSWLEETYINNEETDVDTLVAPVSGDTAFLHSIFPGLIIHGSGHFYAKNQNVGMSLMSAEIVSLIIMAVSINEVLAPVQPDQSNSVSTAVFLTGLTMFTVSWAWDMIFARSAAADYNSTHTFLLSDAKPAADAASVTSNTVSSPASVIQPDAVNNTGNAAVSK